MRYMVLSLCFFLVGCCEPGNTVDITLVHLNDVYELAPLESGNTSEGGLARVATLVENLEKESPHTYLMLAGDLISPSALGHAKINADGEKLAGEQMIDVMNAVGLDYMAFGNHEFDWTEDLLIKRINESEFTWFTANVTNTNKGWPEKVKKRVIFSVPEDAPTEADAVKVGIFSVTLDSNPKDYLTYDNHYEEVARAEVKALKAEGAQIIIGLTHLSKEDDINLAMNVEGIDLILGGHEHENMKFLVGEKEVTLAKADANARTAYIHRLSWDIVAKELMVTSELKKIDDSIAEKPEVKKIVDSWIDKAFTAFRKDGMEPEAEVVTTTKDLDGREASVRTTTTELTRIVTKGMLQNEPDAVAAVFNGGSIRIDDVIHKGQKLTEYDVMRILPFGGDTVLTSIQGSLLKQALETGESNAGSGGFLHYEGISKDGSTWKVGTEELEATKSYKVMFPAFLLEGNDGLDFLKVLEKEKLEDGTEKISIKNKSGLKVLQEDQEKWQDIRKQLVAQLKQEFPAS